MLKASLALLVALISLGTASAQEQHSLAQLQRNARVLMVFAPDSNSASFKAQLTLIERHSFELSARNTVVVPISTASRYGDERFSFENLPLGTATDQAEARTRFHVKDGDFVVILLSEDGTEQIRSARPVDIHELTARLDAGPRR